MNFRLNSPPTDQPPSVLQYVDVHEFLKDVYQFRKNKELDFSYLTWSKELGFKSRTFLQLVVTGKRKITDKSLSSFITGLSLKKKETEYFELLVKLSRANTLNRREQILSEVTKRTQNSRAQSVLLDHHQLYSSELGPQVQTLLTLKDWNATAKKIATVLNSSISEIENLLHILKNLDLATVQNGIWTAKTPEFHTKDSLGDLTLQTFHKKSLLTAIRHLDSPPKNRRYFAVHLTLDDQQMEELATEMKKTCFEYLSKFGTDSSKNKRLYQINLNLIPVSPQLSTEKPKSVPVGGASSLKQGEKHD